jgi:hypothetical protein
MRGDRQLPGGGSAAAEAECAALGIVIQFHRHASDPQDYLTKDSIRTSSGGAAAFLLHGRMHPTVSDRASRC